MFDILDKKVKKPCDLFDLKNINLLYFHLSFRHKIFSKLLNGDLEHIFKKQKKHKSSVDVSLCKLVIKRGAYKALLLGSRAMKATLVRDSSMLFGVLVIPGKVLALAIRLQESLLAMKQSKE